ncbi:hypothetical protein ADK60_14055 [Streptomyces sp. XY431]|uniref:hypothetical protein n=1 Tax=Streptomyces sp. XY431 TaxID=1415562 RepID=UPI0006AFDA72|nr:hypothetical protein [Streptomyces sp. XY431]KOV32372.1 hypothetical protein ADK60_14055 [Streptomyces sp. XY431]
MDLTLVVVFVALVVALVLGSLALLVFLIAYIVRVCVAKARTQDMPVMVQQFIGLIGALEKYTPRHQGVRQLAAPLRSAQIGQQNGAPAPSPTPQPPVIPGQVVGPSTAAAPAGGAQ